MRKYLRNEFSSECINDLFMIINSWKTLLEYFSQIEIIHKSNKQPKTTNFTCMIKQRSCDKVHALNITDNWFILSICN